MKPWKRLCALSLALAVTLGLSVSASAAQGWQNFEKTKTYQGQFSDVPASQWYAGYVEDMYEYGLVNGRTSTSFAPNGTMTIAEVIVLADRIHNLYYDRGLDLTSLKPGSYEAWYMPYVEYAVENDIIEAADYIYWYNTPALRRDVARILCNAVPASALPAIHELDDQIIPDLNGGGSTDNDEQTARQVRRLYEAGVLTGSDQFGSLQGPENIKRCEVMALATRLVDPSQRKTVLTMVQPTAKDILVNGYWQNYGVTLGTQAFYRFHENGTYTRYDRSGTTTGSYTLSSSGVLNISYYGIDNMKYHPQTGVFGHNVRAEIQGMWMTIDALTPATKATFDQFRASAW